MQPGWCLPDRRSQNLSTCPKNDIRDLPAAKPGHFNYYWDTRTRGLFLLVTSNGFKTFYVRRKLKGKSERLLVGRFPDLSIEQARAKAAEFHSMLATGKNLAEARRLELQELTLGELFDAYMERHAKKTKKSWANMAAEFERSFSHWKTRKLSMISNREVDKLHAQIGEARGKYAANRSLELLRAIYNKGKFWKIFSGDNPAEGISPFPEESRSRILQADEFEKFFVALQRFPDLDFKDFVTISLLTGARKSNVLSMSWKDINLPGATWTIPGELSKNGHEHVIPLTAAEIEILSRRYQSRLNEFVFPGKGGVSHFKEPKRQWANLLQSAKITNLHLHDLRRSLASWMANTGANASLIRGALNHKDIKTTLSVYAITVKDSEREARKTAHDFMLSHKPKRSLGLVPNQE